MKKILLTLAFSAVSTISYAQTAFEKIMTEKVAALNNAKTEREFIVLANDFDRIAQKPDNNEKWLPNYYASLANIKRGRTYMMAGKTTELDEPADTALKYAQIAAEQNPNSAEIYLLMKMAHSLKMLVDPMSRYMSEGSMAAEMLAKAEGLDPANPRIAILKAEDLYFTPAQYGGSKEKGLEMFQKALELYKNYNVKSNIHPNWGKDQAEYFIKNKP